MKKYSPSINNNNQVKDDFIKEFNSILYQAEKGKVHPHIDKDVLKPILATLRNKLEELAATLGTGEEDVSNVAKAASKALANLKENLGQELITNIDAASDELMYSIDVWEDVLSGNVELVGEDAKEAKVSWSKKKLDQRLVELKGIEKEFAENEKRLEGEIISLEKIAVELDDLIAKEDNERKINEIYRKIKTNNSKMDSLNVRRSNYSACFNLLDLIFINAKELVAASNYSYVDYVKAKAYLDISKLKQVINDPDKAVSVLKRMEKDLSEILKNTDLIDKSVTGVNNNTVVIDEEALKYKEELLKKRRDKKIIEELDVANIDTKKEDVSTEIKGEK